MMKAMRIAVLPGDGIGPEVVEAALPAVEAAGLAWELEFGEIGWECWRRGGDPVPEATWKLLARCDSALLGAITSRPAREAEEELPAGLRGSGVAYVSPVIQLRRRLDLYANVRPVTGSGFQFTVIRENTEGLYAGFDQFPVDDALWALLREHPNAARSGQSGTAASIRLQTAFGAERVLRYAFEHAAVVGADVVTVVDKPNVLRASGSLMREAADAVAAGFPGIACETLNADAVAMLMVTNPERFQVMVAENMFGDILSDLGAGLMGGLGVAPSGNIGAGGSFFEPVHGSAPDIAGTAVANPMAALLSIALLAEHVGATSEAAAIKAAVSAVAQGDPRWRTPDLAGTATTAESARAIIERI
jgi:isocitrate/isopropylmalate dehydrogenase